MKTSFGIKGLPRSRRFGASLLAFAFIWVRGGRLSFVRFSIFALGRAWVLRALAAPLSVLSRKMVCVRVWGGSGGSGRGGGSRWCRFWRLPDRGGGWYPRSRGRKGVFCLGRPWLRAQLSRAAWMSDMSSPDPFFATRSVLTLWSSADRQMDHRPGCPL